MNVKKEFFIALVLFCLCLQASAQSTQEVDLLRSLNPFYKTNSAIKFLSQTAQPLSAAIPLGILVASLINENKNEELNAYGIAGSTAIAAVTTVGLKLLIKRPRPYEKYSDIYPDEIDNTSSFPSAHTSIAFSTATSLALVYKKWYISVPAFVWAGAVGYSRLYLGQHYPSDVVAGAAIGIGSAYASRWLNKKLFGKPRKKVDPGKLTMN